MLSQWIHVRVVRNPIFVERGTAAYNFLKEINRFVEIAQFGLSAGTVIKRGRILGFNRHRPGDPFARPLVLAGFN